MERDALFLRQILDGFIKISYGSFGEKGDMAYFPTYSVLRKKMTYLLHRFEQTVFKQKQALFDQDIPDYQGISDYLDIPDQFI